MSASLNLTILVQLTAQDVNLSALATTSSAAAVMADAIEMVEQEQNAWLGRSQELSKLQVDPFAEKVRMLAGKVLRTIAIMQIGGAAPAEIKQVVVQLRSELRVASQRFFQDTLAYREMSLDVKSDLAACAAKIQATSLEFPTFTPGQKLQRDHLSNDLAFVQEIAMDSISEQVHRRYGGRIGRALDLGYEIVTTEPSETATSPVRDRVTIAAVQYATVDLLASAAGNKKLLAYFVVSCCEDMVHTAQKGIERIANKSEVKANWDSLSLCEGPSFGGAVAMAQVGLSGLRGAKKVLDVCLPSLSTLKEGTGRLTTDDDMRYWWDRQWLMTAGEGPMFCAAVGQAKGAIKLGELAGDACAGLSQLVQKVGDALHLTDQNIAQIAKSALAFVAKSRSSYMASVIIDRALEKSEKEKK